MWDSYLNFGFDHCILFHYRLLFLWTIVHPNSGSKAYLNYSALFMKTVSCIVTGKDKIMK